MQSILDKLTAISARMWPHRPEKEDFADETMMLARLLADQEREIKTLRERVFRLEDHH